MSTERVALDEETHYICGQCGLEQYHLKSEPPPIPCVDCGYVHKDRKKFDLPSEIKLDLTKY